MKGDLSSCDLDESDDEPSGPGQPSAFMAVRSELICKVCTKPLLVTHMAARPPMELTFPQGEGPPEGSDRKFTAGALKSRTFLNVTVDHPEQCSSTRKSKTLSSKAREQIQWVDKQVTIDPENKQLTPNSERHILVNSPTSTGMLLYPICIPARSGKFWVHCIFMGSWVWDASSFLPT